ncbi:MAG: type II secretion system F family protein [Eubacteriales bacterium]|nr:type II secretion system F family protein [Eubacteriales bacterium]
MNKKDYGEYRFNAKEMIRYGIEGAAIGVLLNLLFYQNLWVSVGIIPLMLLYFRQKRKQLIREQRKTLNYQFKDALASLSIAFQAGYSAENAVRTCRRDLERLYGREADLVKEFLYIENQMEVSVPVENLFLDLGERSGLEDIENFAAVFAGAKRSGGDMEKIILKTARMLGDKIDIKKEIEATLAAKKSEQMIMSLMPFGIILYMQLTSPGFLSVLYGNLFGAGAMTVCLAVYFLAYWMGKRIVDIKV